MNALTKAFTANRAAIDAASRYESAKSVCAGLSDLDRAYLAQWLIDGLEHMQFDPTNGCMVNIEDLKIQADDLLGEIAKVML